MSAYGRGFTIIETLVVIAILMIIMAMSAPLLSGSIVSRSLGNYVAEAVDAVREAQAATMNGRNNAKYGVHFQSSQAVFFQGATYATDPTSYTTHAFANGVSISSVSLSPGGACTVSTGSGNCDLHFASRRGTPTETGTITFTEVGGTSKTVTVNAAGMVDAN